MPTIKAETREQLLVETRDRLDGLPERIEVEDLPELTRPLRGMIRHHEDALHLARWTMAVIALRVKVRTPYGSKTEEIKALADEMGIGWTTLGFYMGCVERMSFNLTLFDRFLRTGYRKRVYHIRRVSQADADPEVLGAEGLAELVAQDVMRTTEKIDRLVGNGQDVDGAVESASLVMTESAQSLLDGRGDGEQTDPDDVEITAEGEGYREDTGERVESLSGIGDAEHFMNVVRACNCMACGAPGPSDPHHVDQRGGWARQGSDWTVIPLCRTCHNAVEDATRSGFIEETGLDPWHGVARMLHIYVAGKDIGIDA